MYTPTCFYIYIYLFQFWWWASAVTKRDFLLETFKHQSLIKFMKFVTIELETTVMLFSGQYLLTVNSSYSEPVHCLHLQKRHWHRVLSSARQQWPASLEVNSSYSDLVHRSHLQKRQCTGVWAAAGDRASIS